MPKKKSVKKKPVSTQSSRLKSVKKKPVKKVSKKENAVCETGHCNCNVGCLKLSSMAFILFLITVWPKIGSWLINVHWGWYLGIFIVFGALAASTNKNCWCCKK